MPGQCYSCGTEFGVFKKEHGCKNCGFAFCKGCLHPKKTKVPKKNDEKHHVCDRCFRLLTGELKEEAANTQFELPEAYIKRVEALKERDGKKSVLGEKQGAKGGQNIPSHLRHLDKPDREIAMRLERLKDSDKPKEKITNADISARLANIQGQPYNPEQKPAYRPPDRRLQQQQIDDLLDEIAAEVEIDSQAPHPVKDIEARLKQLQKGPGDQMQNSVEQPNENNLNKDSVQNANKDKMYNKNIGNFGEASSSDKDIDTDELQRLMEKTAVELEVDAQKALNDMQKDKELMERLKEIQKRKKDKENNEEGAAGPKENLSDFEDNASDDSEEDEDKAAKRIIQRYLEEVKIDERTSHLHATPSNAEKSKKKINNASANIKPKNITADDNDDYDDNSELPYCSICTEDAVIRCRDCDMDLFCQRCFRECHQEIDIKGHRTTPYKAPKGYH